MSATQEIQEYITSEFAPDVRPEELDPDYDLLESGIIDSLRLLRLITWVAERYQIPVEEIETLPENFRTVGAIRAYIEEAARHAHAG